MGDNHSLSEKVFHKLQEDILSGKYAVDEELKEKTIGDELGVSRTPVREALRQLELQGLVTITPNKGAHVTGFSKEDLNDIYEIRSVMEGLCAKWAAKKAMCRRDIAVRYLNWIISFMRHYIRHPEAKCWPGY